jgi:hypothetical protein
MSTAAVSSSSIFQELQSFYHARQTDLKQLGSALQSGDLTGAQQAYTNLAALGAGGPFANSEPFDKSSRVQDFEDVGQALQSGDLAGAQSAFAALTSKQRDATASAQATPAAVVNLTSSQPSGTPATASGSPAASIYEQLQAYHQQRQADVTQLGQDLKAGDVNAAQQEFAALTALGQTGPDKNGQTFGRADRNQDLQAIGKALESGNLAEAQSAFAALESDVGNPGHKSQTISSASNSGTLSVSA